MSAAYIKRAWTETDEQAAARKRREVIDALVAEGLSKDAVEAAYEVTGDGCASVSLLQMARVLEAYRLGVPAAPSRATRCAPEAAAHLRPSGDARLTQGR